MLVVLVSCYDYDMNSYEYLQCEKPLVKDGEENVCKDERISLPTLDCLFFLSKEPFITEFCTLKTMSTWL